MDKKRILVIGDIMLDIYHFGKVNRISPEAPVPVLLEKVDKIKYVPGGAANVAVNLVAAGVDVSVLSIIGQDENGKILLECLEKNKIDIHYVYQDVCRPTTTKLRYIGQNNQQLLRVDIEEKADVDINALEGIFRNLRENISQYKLFLLSDYNKGMLTVEITQFLISLARKNDIPVLVDVKDSNYMKYKGATILKPNRDELQLLTAKRVDTIEDTVLAASELCKETNSDFVLTTLGADGMVLADKNGLIQQVSSVAKEVYDVTGAGDTSIAYLAAELIKGNDICKAMEFANYAAGVQVSKMGTSVVYPREVKVAMRADYNSGVYKQLNMYQTNGMQRLLALKHENKKIVFTNGCFDILHAGHVNYLRQAKNMGDILVIGVNSDASVKRLKGAERPVNSLQDRLMLLSALEFVDYVVAFEEDTPLQLIEKVIPDVLVKGGDYKKEEIVGADFVIQHGGEVSTIKFVEGKSTTNIIEKIRTEG